MQSGSLKKHFVQVLVAYAYARHERLLGGTRALLLLRRRVLLLLLKLPLLVDLEGVLEEGLQMAQRMNPTICRIKHR